LKSYASQIFLDAVYLKIVARDLVFPVAATYPEIIAAVTTTNSETMLRVAYFPSARIARRLCADNSPRVVCPSYQLL
jgi:hypothetical protein